MNDLFSHNIYKRARLNRSGTSAKRSLKQPTKEANSSSNTTRIHDEGSWMNALSNSSSTRKEWTTEKRAQYQQKTLDGFFGRNPSCAKSTTSDYDADVSMNEDPVVRSQEGNQQGNGVEDHHHPLVMPLDHLLQWRNASTGLTKELTDILYQCETAKALLHYVPQEETTEFEIDELGDTSSEEDQLED